MSTVAGRVLFDFVAEGYPEISVREGDRVDVHYAPKGSPWIYVHTKSGDKGYIPIDYFEEDGVDGHASGLSEEEIEVMDSRLASNDQQQSSSAYTRGPPSDRHSALLDAVSTFNTQSGGRNTNSFGYATSSRDAAVTALAASAAAQVQSTKYRRMGNTNSGSASADTNSGYRRMNSESGGSYTRPPRLPGEIPDQIQKQVSGYSLQQCVLVTFHREFVPQISSLLGYFGSQFGVILNRMKIRYDEVRPYTIAVFEYSEVAERVLEQTEHLVHDKSRVTKPIRIRVFPLYDYGRVFP